MRLSGSPSAERWPSAQENQPGQGNQSGKGPLSVSERGSMDAIDGVAMVGLVLLIPASLVLEAMLIGTVLAGFVLSVSLWRLYGGRVWEALGWLCWVGTAVLVVVGPRSHLGLFVVFLGSMILGAGFLIADRLEKLPDIWLVSDESDH